MRILQIHNKYRPGWGGEDTVADLEAELLRANGHEVERLSVWTGELEGAGSLKIVGAGLGTVWSFRGYALTRKAIASFQPHLVHVHNFFPLLSPSVFWAANGAGVPVVQTLHNYRLTCANALLLRGDKPCEKCVGRFPWPALRYRCLSSSFFRTLAVTSMNVIHNCAGTYRNKVQAYIALTDFSKEIFVRSGLPREKIFIKPNFTAGTEALVPLRSQTVVYAGAINRAKGVHLLMDAWSKLKPPNYKLVILGDGPDRPMLQSCYAADSTIEWLGSRPRKAVIEYIATSRWLVLPSLAYENFAMSVLEAFSVGTPVIVPGHGAFAAIVADQRDGLHFAAGDKDSLSETLSSALTADVAKWTRYSELARAKYLSELTAESNYHQLVSIYQNAMNTYRITGLTVAEKRFSGQRLGES